MTDSSAFNLFYYQLKQVSSMEKKLFLLKREKFLCFTPEQKLGGKFKWMTVSRLIKSAVYSRDRIEILKILINYIEPMTDFEWQRFVALTFDLKPDRIQAYHIINQCNGTSDENEQNTDFDAIYNYQEPNMCDVRDVIENYAKTTNRRSVFEMPFLSDLEFVSNYIIIPETKENIQTEIANRKKSNRNFYIPSKVASISMNLKPYRQIAIADRDSEFSTIRNSNRRNCKSLINLKSPEEVHQIERNGDENKSEQSTERANLEKDVEEKAEIKISHYKKRIQKNHEAPPRFCGETILAKSQSPLFPPRFLRRNVQSDFVSGCFYSRNKTSVR